MSCSGVLGSLLLLPCVGACILTHTPCAGILRPNLLRLSGLVLGGGLAALKADLMLTPPNLCGIWTSMTSDLQGMGSEIVHDVGGCTAHGCTNFSECVDTHLFLVPTEFGVAASPVREVLPA